MNHHLWKQIGIEITLLFIISLTPLLWFRPGMMLVGHDNTYPLEAKPFLQNRLHTWSTNFFGYDQSLILGTIPIHTLDALPTLLGFDRITGQKIVYVTWFFLIGFSAYIFASILRPSSRIFKIIATLFYQYNFFILQGWWIGEKSKFSAYIALPLILAILYLGSSGRLSVSLGSILIGIAIFFFNAGGLYGGPLYGGLFIAIVCFCFWTLMQSVIQKDFRGLRRTMLLLFGGIIAAGVMNAYYVLPAIAKLRTRGTSEIAQIGGASGALSWADEISANASFINLMRLQGIPEWYDNSEHPYAKTYLTNPLLVGVSLLFPILVFSSLLVVHKRDLRVTVVLFFLIYLVGMFFAAGTHPPLGFLYKILVEKLPGFIIFRSPYFKFASAIMLAQAFLSAFTIDSLPKRWRRRIAAIVALGILVYHAPFFTGNFFSWRESYSTRLAIPQYVFFFGTWLRENPRARVLLLPPNSPSLNYSLYKWGYLSYQALPTLVSNTSVVVNNDKLNRNERELTELLYKAIVTGDRGRISRLISLLGVTHVLVQHDASTGIVSSLPLMTDPYEEGMGTSGLFTRESTFGEWDLYSIAPANKDTILLVSSFELLDAKISDSNVFIDHLNLPTVYVETNDAPREDGSPVVVAECANCPKFGKPNVVFPERSVLPGNPFYSVVTLFDRLKPLPSDPKSAIYSLLGKTLKQISEVNEMLFQQKPLSGELVGRYRDTLKTIVDIFQKLPTLKDKMSIASDIAHYLREERNYLRPNLGKFVTGGTQTILTGLIFTSIASTEKSLESYVAPYADSKTRLYQVFVNNPSAYKAYIYAEDLLQAVGENRTIVEVTLDDTQTAVKVNMNEDLEAPWLSLGDMNLTPGFHIIRLSLPESPSTRVDLKPLETEFSANGENACFGSTISDITGKSLYRVQIDYRNDFSDNLLLFIWEWKHDEKRLLMATRLAASSLKERVSEIFDVSDTTKEAVIAICAPNINQERASTNIQARINKLVYPGIVLVPRSSKTPVVSSLIVSHRSPTRYEVTVPPRSGEQLLVFYERFDPWWELTGTSGRHVLVNGYANGWLIDGQSGKTLVLRYRGEAIFMWGKRISMAALLVGLAVILFYRHRFYVQ